MPHAADPEPPMAAAARTLPPDDAQRLELHDEVHARPPERIASPARVLVVATRADPQAEAGAEIAHLAAFEPTSPDAAPPPDANWWRARRDGWTLHWERHSEFSRVMLVAEGSAAAEPPPALRSWLAGLPGRVVAAIDLDIAPAELSDPAAALAAIAEAFGGAALAASRIGRGHSLAAGDFRVRADGFERIALRVRAGTSATRVGRTVRRLVEIELYRLMALRGLPVAKALAPMLAQAEAALADVTARLEARHDADDALLDALVHLAAGVERATAEHQYRFAATRAYDALVAQRIAELREEAVEGTPTIGEFMRRRFAPAVATIDASRRRLESLSARIERAGALMRTRVDIASQTQQQRLLERITGAQQLQLRLQTTVEGLSIAAISYYVVSLVLYGAKAAKSVGVGWNPELVAGLSIPLVLAGVAWLTRRIHAKVLGADGH